VLIAGPCCDGARGLELSTFQKRFARRVRRLREARGLRQDDLEEFGLAWKSIQKLEYGITDPKVSTLLKLSRALAVPLDALVDLDQPIELATRRR
jgi:transcriptional regulator with XRE-family HTH domain